MIKVTIDLSVQGQSVHVSHDFFRYFCKHVNLPEQYVLLLLDELAKFLYLSAVAENPVSPTPGIDRLWHELILWDLEEYLCLSNGLTGKIVNHKRTDMPYPRENLEQTAIARGIKLNPKIWGIPNPNINPPAYSTTLTEEEVAILQRHTPGSEQLVNDLVHLQAGSPAEYGRPTAGKTVMYEDADCG